MQVNARVTWVPTNETTLYNVNIHEVTLGMLKKKISCKYNIPIDNITACGSEYLDNDDSTLYQLNFSWMSTGIFMKIN